MSHSQSVAARLAAALTLIAMAAPAQVVLVEPGHLLRQHVDSAVPLHPTQSVLDTVQPVGDIESIAVDPRSGSVFVQLNFPPGSAPGATTHVFRVTPAGVVAPVALNTGFGINERGTDMHLDLATGLLVTQDGNTVPERIAFVQPVTGLTGTWSSVATPPIFQGGTFGMAFSAGAGGSIVPAGDIVFTSDVVASGIHSATFLGVASTTHVPAAAMPGAGDDLVVQPDGDWIHVGDFTVPITQFLPFPPHLATPSALSLQAMFTAAGLPFVNGARATVCPVGGHLYVSFSGGIGGSGIFRVDEKLTTATLILTIGAPSFTEGLQDLCMGPSSFGPGNSVWFTVHDAASGGEEVWEVSATACCPVPASAAVRPDPGGLNVPASIGAFPPGNLPQIGNTSFAVGLDDPGFACAIGPGSPTFLIVAFAPATLVVPGFGCAPFSPGDIQVTLAPPPVFLGPILWPGPVLPAVHPLPIPFVSSLCGGPLSLQGVFFDPTRVGGTLVMGWALDLVVGS